MSGDPYAALGVARTATQDEIKRAYRRLAKESHPDLNPGDATATDRFKAAAAAWDLLKDPETRARFDRGEIDASGHETPERRFYRDYAEGPEATYRSTRGFQDFQDMSGVFEDLFGARARRTGAGGASPGAGPQLRGPDRHYTLEVGFLDAARGATQRIVLPDGAALEVRIPAGLADGQTLRLRGKGGPGLGGGPPGDALVTVSVAPHPWFRREDNDVLLDVPIGIDEAVLGARIEVPTLEGPVSLTVPNGASSGQVLRLRGRGINGGDQRVTLRIVAPRPADADLQAALAAWRERSGQNPRKGVFP